MTNNRFSFIESAHALYVITMGFPYYNVKSTCTLYCFCYHSLLWHVLYILVNTDEYQLLLAPSLRNCFPEILNTKV